MINQSDLFSTIEWWAINLSIFIGDFNNTRRINERMLEILNKSSYQSRLLLVLYFFYFQKVEYDLLLYFQNNIEQKEIRNACIDGHTRWYTKWSDTKVSVKCVLSCFSIPFWMITGILTLLIIVHEIANDPLG